MEFYFIIISLRNGVYIVKYYDLYVVFRNNDYLVIDQWFGFGVVFII